MIGKRVVPAALAAIVAGSAVALATPARADAPALRSSAAPASVAQSAPAQTSAWFCALRSVDGELVADNARRVTLRGADLDRARPGYYYVTASAEPTLYLFAGLAAEPGAQGCLDLAAETFGATDPFAAPRPSAAPAPARTVVVPATPARGVPAHTSAEEGPPIVPLAALGLFTLACGAAAAAILRRS